MCVNSDNQRPRMHGHTNLKFQTQIKFQTPTDASPARLSRLELNIHIQYMTIAPVYSA